MFFNKKKKSAKEISHAVRNSLNVAFLHSNYMDREAGAISFPDNFWKDSYVIGFVHSLCGGFLHYVFGGANMSAEKKGEIIVLAFQDICQDEWLNTLQTANQLAVSKSDVSFNKGSNDAATLFGTTFGLLKAGDNDPVLVEARELAKGLANGEVFPGAPEDKQLLATSVALLTINKHIRENYLLDQV